MIRINIPETNLMETQLLESTYVSIERDNRLITSENWKNRECDYDEVNNKLKLILYKSLSRTIKIIFFCKFSSKEFNSLPIK